MFVTPAFAQATTTENAEVPAHDAAVNGDAVNTETGVAHGTERGVFPPFDQSTFASQLLWLVITFAVFYLLMSKVIVPRIGAILETRHGRIAKDLDEAARLKGDADAAIASYEQELAAAKSKGHAIAATARDSAKAKADADRAALDAGINEKIAAAEVRIGEIKNRALAEVGTIAEDTAAAVIERLTGTSASPAEVADAIRASGNGK